jgi:hypothetical protein
MQGNFFKNKEILNGWKEIMFFENGSTASSASVVLKFNKESDRKTPFERRKIVFFKNPYATGPAIFGINSSRVTVSDHFY